MRRAARGASSPRVRFRGENVSHETFVRCGGRAARRRARRAVIGAARQRRISAASAGPSCLAAACGVAWPVAARDGRAWRAFSCGLSVPRPCGGLWGFRPPHSVCSAAILRNKMFHVKHLFAFWRDCASRRRGRRVKDRSGGSGLRAAPPRAARRRVVPASPGRVAGRRRASAIHVRPRRATPNARLPRATGVRGASSHAGRLRALLWGLVGLPSVALVRRSASIFGAKLFHVKHLFVFQRHRALGRRVRCKRNRRVADGSRASSSRSCGGLVGEAFVRRIRALAQVVFRGRDVSRETLVRILREVRDAFLRTWAGLYGVCAALDAVQGGAPHGRWRVFSGGRGSKYENGRTNPLCVEKWEVLGL